MAKRLSRIYGTEEDKVNCSFYFKIGACRHGDKCTRLHNRPQLSQTLLIPHMYENPPIAIAMAEGSKVPEHEAKKAYAHFEEFYEDIFTELCQYGELEELNICDNVGDHLKGNVYVKFSDEEHARKAIKQLNGRYFSGKPLMPEFSPVTDFREAVCRQFQENQCRRGGFCNFMHLKHISRSFKKCMFKEMNEKYPEYREKARRRRSRKGRERSRDRHRRRHGDRRGSGRRKRSKSRSRSRSQSGDVRKMMNSEERRKQIEKWNNEITESEENKEDDDNKEKGKEQELPGGGLSLAAQRIISQLAHASTQMQQQKQQKQPKGMEDKMQQENQTKEGTNEQAPEGVHLEKQEKGGD